MKSHSEREQEVIDESRARQCPFSSFSNCIADKCMKWEWGRCLLGDGVQVNVECGNSGVGMDG